MMELSDILDSESITVACKIYEIEHSGKLATHARLREELDGILDIGKIAVAISMLNYCGAINSSYKIEGNEKKFYYSIDADARRMVEKAYHIGKLEEISTREELIKMSLTENPDKDN